MFIPTIGDDTLKTVARHQQDKCHCEFHRYKCRLRRCFSAGLPARQHMPQHSKANTILCKLSDYANTGFHQMADDSDELGN